MKILNFTDQDRARLKMKDGSSESIELFQRNLKELMNTKTFSNMIEEKIIAEVDVEEEPELKRTRLLLEFEKKEKEEKNEIKLGEFLQETIHNDIIHKFEEQLTARDYVGLIKSMDKMVSSEIKEYIPSMKLFDIFQKKADTVQEFEKNFRDYCNCLRELTEILNKKGRDEFWKSSIRARVKWDLTRRNERQVDVLEWGEEKLNQYLLNDGTKSIERPITVTTHEQLINTVSTEKNEKIPDPEQNYLSKFTEMVATTVRSELNKGKRTNENRKKYCPGCKRFTFHKESDCWVLHPNLRPKDQNPNQWEGEAMKTLNRLLQARGGLSNQSEFGMKGGDIFKLLSNLNKNDNYSDLDLSYSTTSEWDREREIEIVNLIKEKKESPKNSVLGEKIGPKLDRDQKEKGYLTKDNILVNESDLEIINENKSFTELSEEELRKRYLNSELCVERVSLSEKGGENIYIEMLVIIDSGATTHLFRDREFLENLRDCRVKVKTAKKDHDIIVNLEGEAGMLKEVLISDETEKNIVSVSRLTKENIKIDFSEEVAKIIHEDTIIAEGKLINDLYFLNKENLMKIINFKQIIPSINSVIEESEDNSDLFQLHRCLGHISMKRIKEAVRNNDILIKDENKKKKIINAKIPKCEVCLIAKFKKKKVNPLKKKDYKPFSKVGMDFKGYFNPSVYYNFTCMYIFIDYSTNYIFTYLCKNADQAAEAIQAYAAKVLSMGYFIQFLQTDASVVFRSFKVKAVLNNLLIVHQESTPYHQWMNGKVERYIGTLMNYVRAMMTDSGAPHEFWSYAVTHATFLMNHTPRSDGTESAARKLLKQHLKGDDIPYFYEDIYKINQTITNSMQPRSIKCKFLSYFNEFTESKITFDEEKRIITIARDIERFKVPVMNTSLKNLDIDQRFNTRNVEEINNLKHEERKIPRSVTEALDSPDSEIWREAMIKERNNFIKYKTFEGVNKEEIELIDMSKILGTIPLFVRTLDNQNNTKCKVRLVLRGDQQVEIDKFDMYAPTSITEMNKLMLNIAYTNGWYVEIFDVSAAFLEGRNDRLMYARVPKFFSEAFNTEVFHTRENIVKVVGNFYGSRQAPRIWYKKFDNILKGFGMKNSDISSTIYIKKEGQRVFIISIHVDDGLIITNDKKIIKEFQDYIKKEVQGVKFSEEFKKFLGIEVKEEENNVFMHHQVYLEEKMKIKPERFHPPIINPKEMVKNQQDIVLPKDFLNRIGILRFIVDRGRPDAIGLISEISTGKYVNNEELLNEAEEFIYSTRDRGIKMRKNSGTKFLLAMCDASLVKQGDAKSRIAGTYFTNENSGAFHTFSTKVSYNFSTIATSSCEIEIKAIFETAQRGLIFRKFMREIGVLSEKLPLIILTDNLSSIIVLKRGSNNHALRLINNRIQKLQEWIALGEIMVKFIDSENNVSDFLTKGTLTKKRNERLSRVLMQGLNLDEDILNHVAKTLEEVIKKLDNKDTETEEEEL